MLLLAAVFRGPLLKPLLVLALRQTLGLNATIAQVGGTITSGLVLRGISARGEAGAGPLAAFDADRISASYALASLLRGREAFLDSLDVTVEGARIDLDLTGPPGAQQAGLSPLPRLPRLTVRDSRVLVRGQGFTLEADGLHGAVARADQAREQAVDIRTERLSLRHPALREGTVSLAIAGRYAPRHLSITAAQLNGEPLVKRASLALGERPGEFDVQLALGLWQGSIEIGVVRRAAGTDVRWDALGVDLQPQLLLVNPALGALRGRLSTSGEVRLDGGGVSTLAGRLSLDWTGAEIAGRAVDHLVIKGSAAPGVVLVERAEGRIGSNELLLQQVNLPAAPLLAGRWRDLLAAASGAFTASFGDVPAFLALWGVDAGKGAVAVPDHRLRLEGSLEKGTIRLVRGDLASGLGKATLDAVTVTFPREDQGWGETAFSGGATVDIPSLKDVSALFPVPSLAGSLRGEISGTGTFARPEGRASLTGRGISAAGRVFGDVELQAQGTAEGIEVKTLQVRQGGNRFAAQDVRFLPATLAAADYSGFLDSLAGSFTLSSTDLPALAALAGIAPEMAARTPAKHLLTLAGTVQGRALAITAGSFAAAGGSITLHAGRVALPPPGADWKKDTTFEGDLEVDIPDLGPIATIFQLPPLQGTLKGRATVTGNAGAPSATVAASGQGILIDGRSVGDVVLKASIGQQRLRIETLEVTRGGDHPLRAALDATYESGQLRIGAFELTGAGGLAVKGEGTIPLDLAADDILSPGAIAIRAQANIPALEDLAFLVPPAYALTGTLRADIVVAGTWKEPEARLEISGERLQLPAGTRFAPPGPYSLSGTVTWGKAEARAEKVRFESPALTGSLSGAWSSPPSFASLFSEAGGAGTGSLALRASFNSPDIRWLQTTVVGLRGLRGGVAGEIAVDGPVGDPVLSGEIRIAAAALRYRDLPPIDALVATATVERRRVTLKEFGGNVGGSPFTLAGTLDFSRMDDPVLDLRLLGKNVLLYRDEGLRVRADSDLVLRGPLSALSLTGEMALTDSLYQKDITVASLFAGRDKTAKRAAPGLAGISFPEPPLRDMRFDVRIIAREPFQIRTTVVRGAARPDMRLTGTGLLPILRGPILVDSARVMLPSGTFEIERGTVLYHEGDPDRPALDFGGRMHSRGYEITAQVGGTLDSPEIILSSIPPLPQEELLLFVLTGAPPGSVDGGSVATMASPMAVYLGRNVVGQLLGGKSRAGQAGFQDRIELQVGREMTRSGSVTLDARLLLLNNPIGRGSTLYLTSEKDIYDQYNAGMKILFRFK